MRAPVHRPSNLTIAFIECDRRAPPPTLAETAGPLGRIAAAERQRYVPPTLQTADAGPLRKPARPAMWPYKWPDGHQAPAADPPPDQPYMPHRIPPTSLELHRGELDSSKFASPAADLIHRLIDLYA